MAKNTTINQELVNKLSNIVKAYDPYTAYIEDYKQYSNAVECNCELDQQFIHTCKEYGYDVKVSFCYSLAESLASDKFDSAEDVVIDYLNSLIKEDDSMKQQDNVTTNNSTTVEKEETTMRTTQELINDALNIKRIQDKKYVTNEMLRAEYQKLTGEAIGIRKTRMVIITKLQEHINQNTKEELNTSFVFDDGLALKILERVIRQADTNKAHNFISDWMLTSIISELVLGHPLKDKEHEYYKSFTAEQKKILVDIRKAFINKVHLVAKTNNGKVTGYYIPAKILVWGRHVYLGVACIYRFMSGNKIAAEYHVSLNGIKNVASGVITELDDNAYATLDSKCVFVM